MRPVTAARYGRTGKEQTIGDSSYTQVNLDDVENTAPRFGLEDQGEVRPAREALGARRTGVTHYR